MAELSVQPGSGQATADSTAAKARAAAAKILGEPVVPQTSAQEPTAPPPVTGKTGTTSTQTPPPGQASAEQFMPSPKQIDAAKELGLTDAQAAAMSKEQADAFERARSLSSKAQGKLARKMAKLEEQLTKLNTQPTRETSQTAGAGTTAFAPPADATLTELFGSKDSPAAKQYVAALEKAHKVDALEARLNAIESGAADKEASQGQKTVDSALDGLNEQYYPGLGKTKDIPEDPDETSPEKEKRAEVLGYARRLVTAAAEDDDLDLTLDQAVKIAANIVFPDALKRQAQDELRKEIEARDAQRIGSPSQRAVAREAVAAVTAEQRAEAARADARAKGIPID
jgi:hypothetical protein